MWIVGGRIRLLLHPRITTQTLLEDVLSSVNSVSLQHLRQEVFEKNRDNPSVIYSLIPGDYLWERPKETFATQFIKTLATRTVFMDEMKAKTDFLSNISHSNIAGSFIGQIYEEILHAKLVKGNFVAEMTHLLKNGSIDSTLRLTFPHYPENFQVHMVQNSADLEGKVKEIKETKKSHYFKPSHHTFEQIDSVAMIWVKEGFQRFFFQMATSLHHPLRDSFISELATSLWGAEASYKYVFVVPEDRKESFKRQPRVSKTFPIDPSSESNPITSKKTRKYPSAIDQYVIYLGGPDWKNVDFIDNLMAAVD
jgi:hypothetical protein